MANILPPRENPGSDSAESEAPEVFFSIFTEGIKSAWNALLTAEMIPSSPYAGRQLGSWALPGSEEGGPQASSFPGG